MQKEIRVVIVEDDPYARDFMSMLLRRDWRTQVVGEYGSNSYTRLKQMLLGATVPVNVIILDTEVPSDETWARKVAKIVQSLPHPPVILYTCTYLEKRMLDYSIETGAGGYIAKNEVLYSLASAVVQAARGQFVISPGVLIVAGHQELPDTALVIDGIQPVTSFTPRERDLSRLGLLFNLSQREIADELNVSTDFVAEVISQIYRKLGIRDMLQDEKLLLEFLQDEKLVERYQELSKVSTSSLKKRRKTPALSTLAFHILTAPELTEFN